MPIPQRRRKNYRKRPFRNSRTVKNRQLVTGKKYTNMERMGFNYGGAIGTVARAVSNISKFLQAEVKYVDTLAQAFTSFTTAGVLQLLSGVAQGTSDITRIGNQVLGKDLTINYTSFVNATPTDATHVRVCVICDKQNDGTDPSISQIFATTGVNSPLNKDYSGRFVLLKSVKHSLGPGVSLGQSGKIYVKLPFSIRYDGSGATVASCKENQIYIVALSSQATTGPTLQWSARFNFYDT